MCHLVISSIPFRWLNLKTSEMVLLVTKLSLMLCSTEQWYCKHSFILWISCFCLSSLLSSSRSRWFHLVPGGSSLFQLVPHFSTYKSWWDIQIIKSTTCFIVKAKSSVEWKFHQSLHIFVLKYLTFKHFVVPHRRPLSKIVLSLVLIKVYNIYGHHL